MVQRADVVHDLEQAAAGRAVIDRLPDRVLAGAASGATERGVIGAHDRCCLALQSL